MVHAYERVVYAVALRLSRRPADAEDLSARAFLHAYRALRGYDAKRISTLALRPWLLTETYRDRFGRHGSARSLLRSLPAFDLADIVDPLSRRHRHDRNGVVSLRCGR